MKLAFSTLFFIFVALQAKAYSPCAELKVLKDRAVEDAKSRGWQPSDTKYLNECKLLVRDAHSLVTQMNVCLYKESTFSSKGRFLFDSFGVYGDFDYINEYQSEQNQKINLAVGKGKKSFLWFSQSEGTETVEGITLFQSGPYESSTGILHGDKKIKIEYHRPQRSMTFSYRNNEWLQKETNLDADLDCL